MSDVQPIQTNSGEPSVKQTVAQIKAFFRFLLSKWLIIVIAGIMGAAIGFTHAYYQKWEYTADLTFALEEDKGSSGMSGALGLASSLGFDMGTGAGGAFNSSNITELIKSRKVVERTLLDPVPGNPNMSLAEMYIQANQWREKWDQKAPGVSSRLQFPPNADRSKFSIQQDSVLGTIYQQLIATNNVNVMQKDKKVSIFTIEIVTMCELFSKFFAEALAKEVSDFYVETKSKKARLNVEILERQTDSVRTELNNAITGVAVANDNTYNLNPALNVRRIPSSRKQVDVQANTAILTQLVANLELARVGLRKETPLIQVIDAPILPLKKEKEGKLKSLILGGFLAGFVTVFMLVCSFVWKRLQ